MESRYKEWNGGSKAGKKTGEKEYPRFPSELEADALQERALRHDRIVRGTSMETYSADNQIGTCMGRQQGPAPGMKQGRALSIERSPLLRIDPQH